MAAEDNFNCSLCGEICKRGVRVACCSVIGCRGCATKAVTKDKVCWNINCGASLTTKDLINDDELRGKVNHFMAKKKAEEEVVKNEEETDIASKKKADVDAMIEYGDEKMKDKEKNRITKEMVNTGPSPKKLEGLEKNELEMKTHITVDMIKSRNKEFDQKLNAVERGSKELRYGAQLELLFTFSESKARCRVCRQELSGDFMVLKHIQMKHKEVYNNIKVVLGAPNMNSLDLCLHKAIKSEFMFAQQDVFPCPVDY